MIKRLLPLVLLVFCVFLLAVNANANDPQKLWLQETQLSNPESSHYDPETKIIFVSNCNGGPLIKDGNGYIAKWGIDGKLIEEKWITGLDAPKGIRINKGKLYTTDIDKIIVVDIQQGKIEKTIPVEGAKFLNDVAFDSEGNVYISDTFGNTIYQLNSAGDVSVFVSSDELEGPNGLYVDGNDLYNAAYGVNEATLKTTKPGRLMKIDLKTKQITPITKEPLGNLDGLEKMANGEWLVTDWIAGVVYIVSQQGQARKIMQGFDGGADIGYDSEEGILIVPHQNDSKLSAYKLSLQ